MSGFVIGSSYGVSTGLVLYGMAEEIIAPEHRFGYLMIWALAGIALAFMGIAKKGDDQ